MKSPGAARPRAYCDYTLPHYIQLMRFAASISSSFILAGISLWAWGVAVPAQDRSGADDRREAQMEWHGLAKGRKEFEVTDPALLPSRLVLAAQQSGCDYQERIKEVPTRFITARSHRFVIVFCSRIVGSHQVFDFSNLQRPRLVEFPFVAHPEGFGTTSDPGWITWNTETGILQAVSGSDVCPTPGGRHTYQLTAQSRGFVLLRVEIQHPGCGAGEWATIWDAPQWSLLTKPKSP